MEYVNCSKAVYHNFDRVNGVSSIITSPHRDGTMAQKERCNACGEVFVYMFLPNGQMADSRRYFLDHIRYFAQPIEEDPGMMAAFLHCNPKAAKRFADAEVADKKHEWFQKEMDEKFRWAIKRAMENKGWVDSGTLDGINRSSSTK